MLIFLSKNYVSELKKKALSYSYKSGEWNFVLSNNSDNFDYVNDLAKDCGSGVHVTALVNDAFGYRFGWALTPIKGETFELNLKLFSEYRLLDLTLQPEELLESVCDLAQLFDNTPDTDNVVSELPTT